MKIEMTKSQTALPQEIPKTMTTFHELARSRDLSQSSQMGQMLKIQLIQTLQILTSSLVCRDHAPFDPSKVTFFAAKDDSDAIDPSNVIDQRTRHAKPSGGYREPGDEEGIPGPEDGTSSGRQ